MTQRPLFIGLYVIGLVVTHGMGPRGGSGLACALAFPMGLAVAVFTAMTLGAVGLSYAGWSLGLWLGVLTGACAARWARRGLSRSELLRASSWTLAFSLAVWLLCERNLSLMSYDSHWIVMLGLMIGHDGVFQPDTVRHLSGWGAFQVVAHSMATLTSQDYLFALQPVLGASYVAVFATGLWKATSAMLQANPMRPLRTGVPIMLSTLALFSIYMLGRHMLYIHTNLAASFYLFSFVLLFWLAEVTSNAQWLPLAFLSLTSFAVQRVETPAIALLMLPLTVLLSRLPRRMLNIGAGIYCIAIAGWYFWLSLHVPRGGSFLTRSLCLAIAAATLCYLICQLAASAPGFQRFHRFVPAVLCVATVGALVAAFSVKPEHMMTSARAWHSTLVGIPEWGSTWYFLATLALLTLPLQPLPFSAVFTVGTAVHVAAIILLAFGRIPYRFGVGDSANRMTLHVLPILFFYLTLKMVTQLNRISPTATSAERAPAE